MLMASSLGAFQQSFAAHHMSRTDLHNWLNSTRQWLDSVVLHSSIGQKCRHSAAYTRTGCFGRCSLHISSPSQPAQPQRKHPKHRGQGHVGKICDLELLSRCYKVQQLQLRAGLPWRVLSAGCLQSAKPGESAEYADFSCHIL